MTFTGREHHRHELPRKLRDVQLTKGRISKPEIGHMHKLHHKIWHVPQALRHVTWRTGSSGGHGFSKAILTAGIQIVL